MGRSWDTKHMRLCTLSKTLSIRQPWLPTGMLIFSPLPLSLCLNTGARGSLAGWRWLPALCLNMMAGCLLQARHGHSGDTKPADSQSAHALPQSPQLLHRAEAALFPRLLGSGFCGSLQSLQA